MKKLNILLAEDDEMTERVTSYHLRRKGHEVVVARTGVEAVSRFRFGKYDLILMDMQMPEMDGLQAIREIRQLEMEAPESAHTPIIAVTTHPDKEEFIFAGVDGYAQKPLSASDLNGIFLNHDLG
jgi:CheY-like chemotaxis protein